MKKALRKNIEFAVLFGFICSILLSFASFNAACDDMRDNVLRLHIIPNSDTTIDQTVKFLIRDEILSSSDELFEQSTDLDQAIKTVKANLSDIEETANRILTQNGLNYTATAEIGETFFETRDYKDFSLPAGTYESLIIKLGKAQGQNWWCVVFPAVCVGTADEEGNSEASLSNSTTEKSEKIAKNKSKYKIKFKSVEIYEEIKKLFVE